MLSQHIQQHSTKVHISRQQYQRSLVIATVTINYIYHCNRTELGSVWSRNKLSFFCDCNAMIVFRAMRYPDLRRVFLNTKILFRKLLCKNHGVT